MTILDAKVGGPTATQLDTQATSERDRLVTILIVAFYLLVDSESIVRTFVRLFPRPERQRVLDAGGLKVWTGE